MFQNTPFSEESFRPEDTLLVLALYTGNDDEVADRAAADAELLKRLKLLDSTWAARNGGLFEYYVAGGAAPGGITSVAQGDDGVTLHPATTGVPEALTDVVITMNAAWEASSTRYVIPVVCYNGLEVPLAHIRYIGDGQTAGQKVILVDNTGLRYGAADPTESEWTVTLHGFVRGLTDIDLGGVRLPVTEEKSKLLGIANVAIKRTTRDGEECEGSFTAIRNKAHLRVAHGTGADADPEILNFPGEDIEKLLFGSAWTAGQANKKTYLTAGKKIAAAVVQVNPLVASGTLKLKTSTAADVGKVFAFVSTAYGCELTEIGNPQNMSQGGTDLIKVQYSLKPREVYDRVFLTSAAA